MDPGRASTSITANLYQHVLPSMDERTANAVANLILGNRKQDAGSAVNPLSTGPHVHEAQEGGGARTPSSVRVSEGRFDRYVHTYATCRVGTSPLTWVDPM